LGVGHSRSGADVWSPGRPVQPGTHAAGGSVSVSRRQFFQLGLLGYATMALGKETSAARKPAGVTDPKPAGDWPMVRGGLLRSNRANIRGKIKGTPKVAWRHEIGRVPGATITADFNEDGHPETYSVENERIVHRGSDGKVVWKSARISRGFSLVGFEDLDGDGRREPLMVGTGLNNAAPLYFIFDPGTGRIRWQCELAPTNGGDTRFGKIDPERKGVQLLRALFPNPGGGELHLFCWDQGIEDGYQLWSWTRHDDFIYFPQLAVGDANGDGRNELLLLSQMCVRMFEAGSGNEISRVAWGKRTRSYGGQFGLWPMKPGGVPGILVVSAYNKVSVIDCEENRLVLRWDHAFEPGVADQDLKGQLQFVQDGVCDLDGDGWAEVVCNQYAGYGDERWRTVVLGARDGKVLAEVVGKVMVGAADVDGDGKAEVFLQDRVHAHDPISGPVSVARWEAGKGLVTIWSAPIEGSLAREPNDPGLSLSRHPTPADRVKLAAGSRQGAKAFFIRSPDGRTQPHEATAGGFHPAAITPPPDLTLPLAGLTATQSQPMGSPLVVDWDGDGIPETVQRTAAGHWAVLKPAKRGQAEPKVVGKIEGLIDPPMFADVDGDGRVEMIAVRMGDSEGPEAKQQPCLEVSRADGTRVWRRAWPADYPYKFTLYKPGFAIMSFSVGRFTGNNPLDVVVSFTGEKAGGHTAVLDGRTGKTVWDLAELYPGMYGSCWDFHPPVVFDYDGDGLDDLVTVCQTVHYTVLRGKDGRQLIGKPRDASSQNFGGEQPLFSKGWCVGAMLGGADIDGDGRPELGVFSSQACVGVTRANGEQLWFLDLPVVRQVPSPGCWADVDGDGRPEAVFIFKDGFVRVYDGMTGAMRWEESLGAWGPITAADVDGDGTDEILFSAETGFLYCLSNQTAPITGSHVRWALEFDGVPGQAIFADVRGTGAGEILVPAADGYLYCLTGAGPQRGRWEGYLAAIWAFHSWSRMANSL
jgi:hypothetical protein